VFDVSGSRLMSHIVLVSDVRAEIAALGNLLRHVTSREQLSSHRHALGRIRALVNQLPTIPNSVYYDLCLVDDMLLYAERHFGFDDLHFERQKSDLAK